MRTLLNRNQLDLAIRVFSGISSGLLIILIGQRIPQRDFAHMQIFFSYGGIVYWIFDFGLLGLAYISAAKGDLGNFAENWKLRSRMIIVLLAIISFGVIFGFLSLTSALLVLVGGQEVIADAHLPIRQILRSQVANLLSVLIRKGMQCGILFILLSRGDKLTFESISFLFGFPTFIILVSDFIYFSRFSGKARIGQLRISSKYFFQSLGTGLASFDYSLMGHFGLDNLIFPYALGQKFARFINIPGQTYLQGIIRAEREIATNFLFFWRKMSSPMLTTLLFSSLASISFISFHERLLGSNSRPIDLLLVLVLIFLPIGSTVSASLNGLQVARSQFRTAAYSTFFSSFIYLSLLWTGFSTNQNGYYVLILGIVVNSITEILFCLYFIFHRKTSYL